MTDTIVAQYPSNLPLSYPLEIFRGDDFLGPVFRFRGADDIDGNPVYLDTSGWIFEGAIYDRQACDAGKVIDFTMVPGESPKYGTQPILRDDQTALLECGEYWYKITANDGLTVRTYVVAPIPITGVG